MKNKLLLLVTILIGSFVNAQTSIVDFEEDSPGVKDTNPTAEWPGDPNVPVVTEVANPSIGGLNTTANCVQFVETSGSNQGNSLQFAFTGSTAKTGHNLPGTTKFVKFLVYSVNQTSFDILLELGVGGTPHFSMEKSITTTLNTWTEIVFDFTGNDSSSTINNAGGWNSNIRIHFNNGTGGSGDTYYIDEYVIDTSQPSFTSVANGDWDTAANWNTAYAPDQETGNITIDNDITITDDISVDNLTINAGKSLSITGNLTNNTTTIGSGASLIVSGTSTGDATYRVSANDTNWHLLSSPVVGATYNGTWITDNDIDDTTGAGTNVAIATYSNGVDADGDWIYATDAANSGTFGTAQGYSIKRDATTNTYIGYKGTLKTDNLTSSITQSVNNWNLKGNPYPSYILVSDLVASNTSNLTASHQTVYVWDNNKSGGAGYDALTGTDYIHPGQGFFVSANNSNMNNFVIDASKLSHQTGKTLYRGSSNPSIKLNLNDGNKTEYTSINYIEGKTKGLDPSFDVGTFTGTSTAFSIYSHLVSNSNGVDFMRQALPNSDFENMIIPIGVYAIAGKEITFSAEALNLPTGLKVFLEDRLNNTFTRLDETNSNYKVTLNDALNGIGRFYLYTTQSSLSVDKSILDNVSIYKIDSSNLRITGLQNGSASIKLFNLLGKQVFNYKFESNGPKDISLPSLTKGIYIAQLQTETGKLNKKIILE